MSERDERESPSGAMHGSAEGAGSPDMPYPRTDAEDTGRGDGGLQRERQRRMHGPTEAEREGAQDHRGDPPVKRMNDEAPDAAAGADREHGGWGDEGIAGGRAGGTGP